MKNKKVLTLGALVGLTIGGLSLASGASAQSYGSPDTSSVETSNNDASVETETLDSNPAGAFLVQDTNGAETDPLAPEVERDGRRGGRGGCNLQVAAEAIGIDEAELKTALDGGDTIADVAQANGISVDAVIGAMVDAKTEHVAEKVTEGRITQDEADEKLADLEDHISDRVNGIEAPERSS